MTRLLAALHVRCKPYTSLADMTKDMQIIGSKTSLDRRETEVWGLSVCIRLHYMKYLKPYIHSNAANELHHAYRGHLESYDEQMASEFKKLQMSRLHPAAYR